MYGVNISLRSPKVSFVTNDQQPSHHRFNVIELLITGKKKNKLLEYYDIKKTTNQAQFLNF